MKKHYSTAKILILISLVAVSGNIYARQATNMEHSDEHITKYFFGIDNIQSAKALLVPASHETRVNLTEKTIYDIACQYDSEKYSTNKNLVDLLVNAKFTISKSSENNLFLRNMVILKAGDKSFKILMDDGGSDGITHAQLYRSDILTPLRVETATAIVPGLRSWAKAEALQQSTINNCI